MERICIWLLAVLFAVVRAFLYNLTLKWTGVRICGSYFAMLLSNPEQHIHLYTCIPIQTETQRIRHPQVCHAEMANAFGLGLMRQRKSGTHAEWQMLQLRTAAIEVNMYSRLRWRVTQHQLWKQQSERERKHLLLRSNGWLFEFHSFVQTFANSDVTTTETQSLARAGRKQHDNTITSHDDTCLQARVWSTCVCVRCERRQHATLSSVPTSHALFSGCLFVSILCLRTSAP